MVEFRSAACAWDTSEYSMSSMKMFWTWMLVSVASFETFTAGQQIFTTNPVYGSLNGGTRITIKGQGFLGSNQFNLGGNNDKTGNSVQLVSATRSVPCDVERGSSNDNVIICTTRPMFQETFVVRVTVDGVQLADSDTCHGNYFYYYYNYYWWWNGSPCYFWPLQERTPSIRTVVPLSGVPGSLVSIHGQFYTEAYGAFNPSNRNLRIKRVYVGGSPCELLKPNSDEPYGLSTSTITCKLAGSYVGHHNASLIVDQDYGRSLPSPSSYFISSLNKLAMFQTFAEITGVSPSEGSVEGGNILTITGNYFDQTDSPAVVLVGGQTCDILSLTNSAITCRMPAKQNTFRTIFPGGRGLKLETWDASNNRFGDAVRFNESTPGYQGAKWLDMASYTWQRNYPQRCITRLSGFLIPPETESYALGLDSYYYVRNALYINKTGSTDDRNNASGIYGYPANLYQDVQLQKGEGYYFELYSEEYYYYYSGSVDIRLASSKTTYTDQQTTAAVNEQQLLKVSSTVVPEIQMITLENWTTTINYTYEVQAIAVTNPCVDSCPLLLYSLIYNGEYTVLLSSKATEGEVQDALNALWSIQPDAVSVTRANIDQGYVYNVTFISQRGDFELLDYEILDGGNITVDITEMNKGIPSLNTFSLIWDGVYSSPIDTNASAEEVKVIIEEMLGSRCSELIVNYTAGSDVLMFEDFEQNRNWNYWYLFGERTATSEAFCGHYSMKNPSYLFYYGFSLPNKPAFEPIPLIVYNQICFAYKGFTDQKIYIYFTYQDINMRTISVWKEFDMDLVPGDRWEYTCVDLSSLTIDYSVGNNFEIYYIYIPYGSSPYTRYIDVLYIGNKATVENGHEMPARRPGILAEKGIFPNRIRVDQTQPADSLISNRYTVTLTPMDCAVDIPLLTVGFAQASWSSTQNEVVYSGKTWTKGSQVRVKRTSAASPPVTGTFDIQAYGKQAQGLSVNISNTELKYALESIPEMGEVSVIYSYRTCYAYSWYIKWITKGGNQPLLQVNDSATNGVNAHVAVSPVVDGCLNRRPITGDMLRTPHTQPQVEVFINGLPSNCSGDCGYRWTASKTPVLLHINPTEGSFEEQTILTISGSGFANSSNNDTTLVSVGTMDCSVVLVTDNEIHCQILRGSAGTFPVTVYIAEVGLAQLSANAIFNFSYHTRISTVTPNSGSLTGGALLTISGYGFNSHSTVMIGNSNCDVLTGGLNELRCISPIGTEGSVNVSVLTNGFTATLNSGFNYTASQTPTITDFRPKTRPVWGVSRIIIMGSGFGNPSADNKVLIGRTPCTIAAWNDTCITCLSPQQPPDVYEMRVQVGLDTFASFSASLNASIEYLFKVSSLSPQQGSLYGGTKITLTGDGFSTNPQENEVLLGSIPCTVTSSSETMLQCVTQSIANTQIVTNGGKHQVYGLGYAWSPSTLEVSVGDRVQWQWDAPPAVQGIGYRVFSVSSPGNTSYDGSGFTSGNVKTSSGSFSYQFTLPGVYFYSSGVVSDVQTIFMQGAVKVKRPSQQKTRLHLSIGGTEATYNPGSSGNLTLPGSDCITQDPECSQSSNDDEKDNAFMFTFLSCYSPSITSISPSRGPASDLLTITGTGFSNITCANEVTIGDYPCVVMSSTASLLTCYIDPRDTMPIWVAKMVSLTVHNLGTAINTARQELDRRFVLLPHIESVMPNTGSLNGRTRLTIHGSGFSGSQNNITVTLAGYKCAIVSANYTDITCDTPPSSVAKTIPVDVVVLGIPAQCRGACNFSYSGNLPLSVSSTAPTTLQNISTEIRIQGEGFGSSVQDILVYIGNMALPAMTVTNQNITCIVRPFPAGDYVLTVVVLSKGLATGSVTLNSPAVATLSPTSGSVMGGTILFITGNGFDINNTRVMIDGTYLQILSVTPGEVQCITQAHYATSTYVIILVNQIQYPQLTFTFRQDDTPTITAVSPSTGSSGTLLTITGTGFGFNASAISVTIGDVSCDITMINDTELLCTVGSHVGGTFPVKLYDLQRGNAQTSASFTYELSIQSVSPGQGSFGGGLVLTVSGSGFDALTSNVSVCGVPCTVDRVQTTSNILFCEAPPGNGNGTLQNCNVRLDNVRSWVQMANAFNYSSALTPLVTSVHPKRGGTAGGTRLTVTGYGFSSDLGSVNVTIAGTVCDVQSANSTQVICITNGHSPSGHAKVKVNIKGQGIAKLDNADFFYIDVWSSNFTWGGESPPGEGFLAVITRGQYILLDVTTPVLKMLLIQGGTLVFDEADIELQSEYILITDGGLLQIGTSAAPFQHKAIITLHGNLRSPEIPLYGAKTLAVREGTLELHGLPIPVTWTRLAETAEAGASTILLENAVTWNSGDEIVIASTGDRKSQMQNEKITISSISSDGRSLTLTQPLKYNHLGVTVMLPNGHIFEAKAEVGLLTRNVLIRGSDNVEWHDVIPACPDGFDPVEFAVQTCFQGRYGEEIGSDQFGACIMFHAPTPNAQLATGRFEYVEISHAGQAFRLGRHPINWDMTGDLQFTSYVRGCAIHESYNRAIVIKSTHHLLVENNVVYDIMGGALFLEDGVEHGNILQYNLAVFVKQSTSLLNDDITPAAYWITNPNNTVRHNAAAGGTHVGFWYKMYKQQDMPSYDSNICPERTPLGEFNNNTVHSQGWMGLLISENYYPVQGRSCYGNPQPAIFQALTTWNCERGAEWLNGGALQFHQFVMVNNEVFGIHTRNVLRSGIGGWGETQGAVIKNATIVGHLDVLGLNSQYCTGSGIGLPADEGLTISATFVNFDRPGCVAIRLDTCNGWDYRFRRMEFFNTSNKASFPCVHAAVLVDLDGTLTGNASQKVIPTMALLDPTHCYTSQEWSFGQQGSVCDSTVRFHRITAYVYPSTISNQFGSISFFSMALLPNANSYYWWSYYVNYPSNFTYSAVFSKLQEGDYLIISHNFTRRPDRFLINYNATRQQYPLQWNASYHGDFYFNENTTTLSYIVCRRPNPNATDYRSPNLDPAVVDNSVSVQIIYCNYKDCIAPTPSQPGTTLTTTPKLRINGYILWSNRAFWNSSAENGYRYPENGSDVVIPADVQMVADVDIPFLGSLTIYGQLTLPDNVTSNDTTVLPSGYRDIVLNTSYIVIQSGGQLIGGTEDEPFRGCLQIILQGQRSSQYVKLQNDQMLRSKVLAVFGTLELHGLQHTEYRSKISHTALKGSESISLVDAVGWEVGDDIVITSTSHNAWQTEIRRITNVSLDGTTLSLNESLSYNHTGEMYQVPNSSVNYSLAADVGLLSRNIKIIGEDYPGWDKDSFGARVLVSRYAPDNGNARISNVEFFHSGQAGISSFSDPGYSVAFFNLGISSRSYIQGCAFHHGLGPAIGVISTSSVGIDDNIIHNAVGQGIQIWGSDNRVRRNIITCSVSSGDFYSAVEISQGINTVLQDNVVAGFENVGYHIDGEPCTDQMNTESSWINNEAYGGLIGVYMNKDGLPGCSRIKGFTLWKCWDYGIYTQTLEDVLITGVTLADNGISILSIIYTPSAVTHEVSDKTVKIKNALIIGSSPNFDCSDVVQDYGVVLTSGLLAAKQRNRTAISWPTFASGHNGAPSYALAGLRTYSAITGLMTVEDSTFVGFQSTCPEEQNVIFMTNSLNDDLQHPIHVSGLQLVNTTEDSKVFIHRPDVSKVTPSACGDLDCDGKKKALLKDIDGSFLGSPGSVIPQSEFQWDGTDKRHGLGDYRIPKVMLTYLNGSRIPINQIAPNKGIIRDSTCTYMSAWKCYKCLGLEHEMLVIESLDPDSETRRLSPVAVLGDRYVDILNGPRDHTSCSGRSCRRLSMFHSIVAVNKSFEIYFSSTSPQKLRLRLLNADDSKAVRVAIFYASPQRLDVYANQVLVSPTNADWTSQNTDYTLLEPSYPGQYLPSLSSSVAGENFFDSEYKMMYVLLRGSTPVEIRTTPKLVIAFNLPPMTVDEFFGPNLVNNLAAFLKIPSSKIRITKIIRESRRRRRRSTGQMSVLVEIADPPSKDINNSTNTTGQLQFSDIQSIADNIGQAVIAGNISASIGVNVSSMQMSTPIPPPWDPESEKVSIPEDRTPVQPNVLATVSRLVVIMEPVAGLPGELLTQQPVIMAADSTGNCVSVGVTALTLTATLMYENNTAAPDGLSGNMTIAFRNCWANYTDLVLELAGTGFKMEFVLNDVISQTRSFASQKSPEPNTTSNTTSTTSSTTSTQSSASTATTTTTKAAAVDPNHGTSLASNTVFQKMALMLGFLLGRQLLPDICIAVTVVAVLSMTVGGY